MLMTILTTSRDDAFANIVFWPNDIRSIVVKHVQKLISQGEAPWNVFTRNSTEPDKNHTMCIDIDAHWKELLEQSGVWI